jgi:hypothetical protein
MHAPGPVTSVPAGPPSPRRVQDAGVHLAVATVDQQLAAVLEQRGSGATHRVVRGPVVR